jgi:hypothetical protein
MKERLEKLEEALEWQHCDECGGVKRRGEDWCQDCNEKFGPVLVKASHDLWPVVVKLKTEERFVASGCDLRGDWVVFHDTEGYSQQQLWLDFRLSGWLQALLSGRGLAVHLSNIAWVNDTDS